MTWSQALHKLINNINVCITSYPVLDRYDPDKPTFLKTDWSAKDIGFILMQPVNDEVSQKVTDIVLNLFDITISELRL